ncbi:MAG: diguanylate cyclase [Alphaproteobacteria bacterium]|nr:diguanylate cyclase [Alphaproteobacteria bacterium]
MKLDNLTPEQQKEWHAMQRENELLKEKLRQMEVAGAGEATTILPRPEFIREIARLVAHDERYGGISSLLVLSFNGLLESKPTLGNLTYGAVTIAISDCILSNVRSCDLVGRTGSNDFSIMLTRCKIMDAEKKAQALVTAIKTKLDPLLQNKAAIGLSYTVSILNSRDDVKKA